MTLIAVTDFIGRFHPVLVHLPIGILLLGCLFQLLTLNSRYLALRPAIPFIYLLGMLAAAFSCITGYLLSQSGDYEGRLVGLHQWLGISVAVVSLVSYLLYRLTAKEILRHSLAVVLIALVALTGHYGGSLTHGSRYLTSSLRDEGQGKAAIPAIADVQQALAYAHMIQPLLKNRCYSCHGADKQKGKLRLDDKTLMLKGGEEGHTIVPGSAEESLLIRRLLLPVSNKDHMPPKEKPQLTPEEIQLLTWWIAGGADFNRKVGELKQTVQIKPVLLGFQSGAAKSAKALQDVPAEEVEKADAGLIVQLKQAGVVVTPVKNNSNYLSASFVTAKADAEVLKLAGRLKKQLVWLNMANSGIDDNGLQQLGDLAALVRINLSNTAVTNRGMMVLKDLAHLQYLNLVGTKVTAGGVEQLKGLTELKSLYLYRSMVNENDRAGLRKLFPNAELDFGGYTVPVLPKDTIEVTVPLAK